MNRGAAPGAVLGRSPGGAPVRVLWLTKGLGPGGAERLLVEHVSVSRDVFDLEFEVAYLLQWKDHLVPELEDLGVRTHCLGVRTEADPRWLLRLRRLVLDGGFGVVHAHSPMSAAMARVLLRTLRPRPAFVYTEHNRWPSYQRVTRVANALTYPLNDASIAVSDDVRSSVAARWRSRVATVLHGIELGEVRTVASERDAVRAELGVAVDEVLAVTVANLRAGKGYPVLLEAARQVIDGGARIRFVAAGQGPLEAELHALHGTLGLGDRFRFLGYRSDARRLLAGADVFVLASLHEGLPVSVMEALALGVPVVASRVGGLPEMIEDGVSGVLVAPGEPGALAAALLRVEDPALRARLGEGARARGDTFSSAAATARINDLYRELAAGPR